MITLISGVEADIRLSNTLGDGMILQRAPVSAIVWGFGTPKTSVKTTFDNKVLSSVDVGPDGIWRVSLPPTPESFTPKSMSFESSDGGKASLNDVLFGDVFLCSGQSNMQYTPRSMAGMNNMTSEIASASNYDKGIRYMTVGQQTDCRHVNCSLPFPELKPLNATPPGGPCGGGKSCREAWTAASSASLGGAVSHPHSQTLSCGCLC